MVDVFTKSTFRKWRHSRPRHTAKKPVIPPQAEPVADWFHAILGKSDPHEITEWSCDLTTINFSHPARFIPQAQCRVLAPSESHSQWPHERGGEITTYNKPGAKRSEVCLPTTKSKSVYPRSPELYKSNIYINGICRPRK
jgi:hypothetical protein